MMPTYLCVNAYGTHKNVERRLKYSVPPALHQSYWVFNVQVLYSIVECSLATVVCKLAKQEVIDGIFHVILHYLL